MMTIYIENFRVTKHLENGFRESLGALVPVSSDEENLLKWQCHRYLMGMHTLVAIDNDSGRVVGTLSILIEPKLTRDCRPAAHIEDVSVHPDWQGIGVGSLLMDTALSIIRDSNCYKVVLDCDPSKVGFYTKHGFKENGVCMKMELE